MPTNDEQGQQLHDSGDLRKYRIELPNLYDDADLDPYEFRLLAHYKRVGNCWESVRTTADKCKMSVGKVVEARDSLERKGFITIAEYVTRYDTLSITVNDVWAQNFEKYSKRSPHEQDRSPSEQGCSPHETKKEPIEEVNNNNNNTRAPILEAWHKALEQATGGYMGGANEFQELTDAWERLFDERRHLEAMRQLQNAHSRTIRVYLKAYLTFNPDYKPPEQKTTYAQRPAKPPPKEWKPATPEEIAAHRARVAAMHAEMGHT